MRRGAAGRTGGPGSPGGALPAGQSAVPGGRLQPPLRAPQLCQEPHEDQAPPPVGGDENVEVE